MSERKRLLIEDWLPAAAIGVECLRERSTGQQPPHARFHVWWARRPLCASRAAVLASLLPQDFPHDVFERLLGFGRPSEEIVAVRALMDQGVRVQGGFGYERAFKAHISTEDLAAMSDALKQTWGEIPVVIDTMSGGGSIPLEAARLGLKSHANELNPVACSVLEATVDYPFRFGLHLADRARFWGKEIERRMTVRLSKFFPKPPNGTVHAYIFARTVPDPNHEGQQPVPLVPDWHLLKTDTSAIVANPMVDKASGTWRVEIRFVARGNSRMPGELAKAPPPSYKAGIGYSLLDATLNSKGEVVGQGRPIDSDWIKAKAQSGEMKQVLYAIAFKTASGIQFRPPGSEDLAAIEDAESELKRLLPAWTRQNILPDERIPTGDKTREVHNKGIYQWSELFTPRQLLTLGTLVEESQNLRSEIIDKEGAELGEAILHLLAFGIDKLANWNASLSSWNVGAQTLRSVFDRHDFAFKPTFAEMAPCGASAAWEWALGSVVDAYADLAKLASSKVPASITQGSATHLPHLEDRSVAAVVVDPPYDDNVQYSELADFFYVWLKRTQGYRRPELFSTYLCDHDQEAVVNHVRHLKEGQKPKEAKEEARAFYRRLMTDSFREASRVRKKSLPVKSRSNRQVISDLPTSRK